MEKNNAEAAYDQDFSEDGLEAQTILLEEIIAFEDDLCCIQTLLIDSEADTKATPLEQLADLLQPNIKANLY